MWREEDFGRTEGGLLKKENEGSTPVGNKVENGFLFSSCLIFALKFFFFISLIFFSFCRFRPRLFFYVTFHFFNFFMCFIPDISFLSFLPFFHLSFSVSSSHVFPSKVLFQTLCLITRVFVLLVTENRAPIAMQQVV